MHIEPGRTYPLAPDPRGNHYIVSEQVEFELRMLAEAMRAAATLCDGFDPERAELDERAAGALLHVFAERAASLLAEGRLVTPGRRQAA